MPSTIQRFLLPLSLALAAANAFQSPAPEVRNRFSFPSSTRLSVASERLIPTTNTEEEECIISLPPKGPASVFGQPIDSDTKQFNRNFVKQCKSILFDTLFAGTETSRCFARFYALESIARMPYFAYLSVLHLYESLGKWRKAEYLKVHFSESWNEQHHLLIMEEMGGNHRFQDRFVAQHVAVLYYWIVVALYMYNPTLAYNLNEAVEEEAYMTYNNFVTTHKDYLESQPAPLVAKQYYTGQDMYLFDAMHFGNEQQQSTDTINKRRPKMDTLYDALVAVRDDELEHVKTMAYLQEDAVSSSCDEDASM